MSVCAFLDYSSCETRDDFFRDLSISLGNVCLTDRIFTPRQPLEYRHTFLRSTISVLDLIAAYGLSCNSLALLVIKTCQKDSFHFLNVYVHIAEAEFVTIAICYPNPLRKVVVPVFSFHLFLSTFSLRWLYNLPHLHVEPVPSMFDQIKN